MIYSVESTPRVSYRVTDVISLFKQAISTVTHSSEFFAYIPIIDIVQPSSSTTH